MIADFGVTVFVVRDKNGEDPNYLNTAWTLRLGRGLLNAIVVFFGAPIVAHLYGIPELTTPLRVLSLLSVIADWSQCRFRLPLDASRRV
jgi:O-antigen/teichoic acid export membrane protein